MLNNYKNLKRFEDVGNSDLSNVVGGNLFSQCRDIIWGFLDGFNHHRESYKKRHRS